MNVYFHEGSAARIRHRLHLLHLSSSVWQQFLTNVSLILVALTARRTTLLISGDPTNLLQALQQQLSTHISANFSRIFINQASFSNGFHRSRRTIHLTNGASILLLFEFLCSGDRFGLSLNYGPRALTTLVKCANVYVGQAQFTSPAGNADKSSAIEPG